MNLKAVLSIAVLLLSSTLSTMSAGLKVRIKDIVSVEGVRENQLIGYGIVVGLKGTGDDLKSNPYAAETIIGMLERLGVNIRDQKSQLGSKNIAAVMVTADMPAFARHGSRLNVSVSAIGTAKDLMGGTLLVTPLMGADGEVYAVAQGSVATGGFTADGKSGSNVSKGVPTSARIINGAIIEREVGFELSTLGTINLALHNPDFTTAKRLATVINKTYGTSTALPKDPTTVTLTVPATFQNRTMEFLTEMEQLMVEPDQIAKVIIDEQNGVIVMGEKVRISTVAISHGNLTIKVTETPQVSQPNPFSNTGTTETVERTGIQVDEEDGKKLIVMKASITLQELVDGLNSLGVSPRDMITILQNIKQAGALQADLEMR